VVGMAVDLEVLGWTLALVFVMAGCVMWMGLCDVPICRTQFWGVNVNRCHLGRLTVEKRLNFR
jgi:hypothetical protein